LYKAVSNNKSEEKNTVPVTPSTNNENTDKKQDKP